MKFRHQIFYSGKDRVEQLRCRDCGAEPNVEWTQGMGTTSIIVMYPSVITCPNGPHEVTEEQYKEHLADMKDEMQEAVNYGKKRGWLK